MNPSIAKDTIVEEIRINAPAERVFEALTNPDERVKWWGKEGRFQTRHMESDLRPGGKWSMSGIGVGGRPFVIKGEYIEISPPHALSFSWLPDWQSDATQTVVRFDLRETDGGTVVRLTHSGIRNESDKASHRGWPEVLAWLQSYVAPAGL